MNDAEPCMTLYVRNLDEKVKKDELRRLLYSAFSPHGRVVSIVALKTLKLRGQAFISFEDVATATNAKQAMQNFELNGKPMVIQYAKHVSDRALQGEGVKALARNKRRVEKIEKKTREQAEDTEAAGMEGVEMVVDTQGNANGAAGPKEPGVPNKVLFLENLPQDEGALKVANELTELFSRFSGFVEVRTVPGKESIAFVEFGDEGEAAVAMSGLQSHKLSGCSIQITYAKR
eukprot:Plantae.Rhodophyta-Hildenbrandia_rubra.ctg13241.p2 GENE.Plantae.Rhodophyta-Hildenbrandia_rubra.ctg13241~~Plantae.Rhodophyta-Hildenbrandia_rubra.ctg13241.p2  ORF type:complete len:232 (-),score=51.90 Plantae.Rhodophyta-Hildenbrandia_rubra.ctg13241:58-753(-)